MKRMGKGIGEGSNVKEKGLNVGATREKQMQSSGGKGKGIDEGSNVRKKRLIVRTTRPKKKKNSQVGLGNLL